MLERKPIRPAGGRVDVPRDARESGHEEGEKKNRACFLKFLQRRVPASRQRLAQHHPRESDAKPGNQWVNEVGPPEEGLVPPGDEKHDPRQRQDLGKPLDGPA